MEQVQLSAVDLAWHSVALEERLELVSRAQATGIVACIFAVIFIGCAGYGFDEIWVLAAGLGSCMFFFPLFSSYSWRRGKPGLILAYLAVKAMARRYAYSFNVQDLDIILIYRGRMKEVFSSREHEELAKQASGRDGDILATDSRDVWICLMRGGVVILREKRGGAKLDFLTIINHESTIREPEPERNAPKGALIVDGVGVTKGRSVMLWSRYPGAHYVFGKQYENLIEEAILTAQSQERLRQKAV